MEPKQVRESCVVYCSNRLCVVRRDPGKWHGRPPFGFDVGSEDYLSPNDDYETALVIIDELDKGISKGQLARWAGVSRMTVMRIDENRERYLSRGTS